MAAVGSLVCCFLSFRNRIIGTKSCLISVSLKSLYDISQYAFAYSGEKGFQQPDANKRVLGNKSGSTLLGRISVLQCTIVTLEFRCFRMMTGSI